jgi:hypothetical protein
MLKKILNRKKNVEKRKKILIWILIFLGFFNIFLLIENYSLKQENYNFKKQTSKIFVNTIFFNKNIELKNYSNVRYKITSDWEKIIWNIKNLHKSPVIISKEFQNKELCAWYIAELSKKIWGQKVIYSIWMQNTKKQKLAQAWELPYFYEAFWWEVLIDLGDKISIKNKDYLNKISTLDLKEFFAKAFSEKALFWDIWFLYSKTKYSNFLKNWSKNSHITKNMWVSDFEVVFSRIFEDKTNLENLFLNLWCNKNFLKYKEILENYEMFLNGKKILFYKNEFYYLNSDNSLWQKVKFKYLDKLVYKDITLAHFFEGKSHVDSLLQFVCKQVFYPINVMSINSRMIEKK